MKVERFCNWIPWQLREPFFHLPVLLPVVWAAATFASVDHRVAGDIYGPLEPTLIALLAAVIAINGFLAIRGRHTIDFLGALATVLVLIAGTTISLVQIASGSNNEIQWVAAALVFGVVAMCRREYMARTRPMVVSPTPRPNHPKRTIRCQRRSRTRGRSKPTRHPLSLVTSSPTAATSNPTATRRPHSARSTYSPRPAPSPRS